MNTNLPGAFGFSWILVYWAVIFLVHAFFAIGVLGDAERQQKQGHRGPFLVGGSMWALATLIGGVTVAGIYWVIHHSTLRPAEPPNP